MNANAIRSLVAAVGAAALAALLAACGGGAEGTGDTPVQPAASFSSGVMKLGSVILNGVRYTDDAGTQVIDDRGRSFAQLGDGMVVKVRGRINADGVSGVAERVEVENELRGTVSTVDTVANPPAFTVNGVVVQTDESTVFANGGGVAGLQGSVVEVHGLRDANGVLRASRVEVLTGAGLVDEFKGAVASKDAGTFTVGSVTVTPAGNAVYAPAGCSFAALAAGQVVEVHGSFTGANAFSASRVECEDLEDGDNGVRPPANARNELEGFITGFSPTDATNTAGSFTLNGSTVTFDSSTQIRNGTRADLGNDVRVEADGTVNGSTLAAREISFKQDRIIVQGTVTAAGQNELTVLGQTIQRNDLTEVSVNGSSIVVAGDRVQVRARFTPGGALIAEEIREASSGNANREIIQARVTAKSADSITVLGLVIPLPTTAAYQDIGGAGISRDAFLAAITAGTSGTLVKVRGEPLNTGVDEAEIEN